MLKKLTLFFAALFVLAPLAGAQAQTPVVRAVLFFSPTCPHCHKVMTEDLPPLVSQYGAQLEILEVDVTQFSGQVLYQAAVQVFRIPDERFGVPNLVIGSTYLVGSVEIPSYLPMLIEQGLATGGIDWPAIPGLEDAVFSGEHPYFGAELLDEPQVSPLDRFGQDPVANSLAVLVLLGMLCSVGYLWMKMRERRRTERVIPDWTIPVLALAGMGIAAYLTFIEVSQAEAVCGPVGDCNAVQQSSYAMLFGVIPIGLLGLFGYAAILAFWILKQAGKLPTSYDANRVLWGFALAGTLFSIYLTFLEPFVIGATCAWCLGSAVIMTALLWATSLTVTRGRRLRGAH